MGKKSEAKRKKKLRERLKGGEAVSTRAMGVQERAAKWFAEFDAAPNVIAELLDQDDAVLAYIEGNIDGGWTVVVADAPLAGTDDEMIALGWLLTAAVDDTEAGEKSFLQFAPWLIEEIERQCDARNVECLEFLRSLLPPDKRHKSLPQQCSL